MLKSEYFRADSSGQMIGVGSAGFGFCIRPALQPARASTDIPGHFPLSVRLQGRSDYIAIPNGDSYYFEERFQGFDVVNATPLGWYIITTFEKRGDALVQSGQKTRLVRRVLSAASLATSPALVALSWDPADAVTPGFKLYPGARALQFVFAGGTPRTISLAVADASRSGTPLYTEELVAVGDFVSGAPIFRTVDFASPGMALYADGAGITATVEVEEEVG